MTRSSEPLPSSAAELQSEYEFQRVLGRGGTAVVYLARDRELGRQVAIKLIHSPLTTDAETLQRFAREARTAGVLRHPNIVSVHAVKRLRDNTLAMIMQYVPGRTLKQIIQKQGPLPFELVERVLRDIGAALAYAHGRGVVHRDVKPENIFLDEDTGSAVLADFGIARTAETGAGLTLAGVTLGTPAYMAPEQVDGTPLDGRADLYSLAIVAWEMLTGEPPWAGESLYSIIYKQKHEPLPSVRDLRPDTPFHLWLTLEGALDKDRERRFPDAAAMLAALDESGTGLPWLRWLRARWRRRRGRVAAAPAGRPASPEPELEQTIRYRRDELEAQARVAAGAATASEPVLPRGEKHALARRGEPARARGIYQGARLPRRRRPVRFAAAVGGLLLATGVGATLYALTQYSPPEVSRGAGAAELPAVASLDFPVRVTGFGRSTRVPASVADDSLEALAHDEEEPLYSDTAAAPPALAEPTLEPRDTAVAAVEAESEPSEEEPAEAAERAPPTGSGFVSVAAGGMHTCAVNAAGEVYCWGANSGGQTGRAGRAATPTRVSGDLRLQEVSTGVAHTCGVTRSGEAVCWGSNDHGQLGDGSATAKGAPVRVASPSTRFNSVRTGRSHTCGLTRQGQVYCWGGNDWGQLGDGSFTAVTAPVRVEGSYSSLAAGWNHTCALDRSGRALCWGDNADGQLGTAGAPVQPTPTTVASRQRFTQITTGGSHSCALTGNGTAYCWGRNNHGQLGDGTTISRATPVPVGARMAFSSLTTGSVHTCGLTSGGEAYCWGRNSYGQLGDGSRFDRVEPVRVEAGLRFTSIHASGAHTCGITRSGEQYCWGYNLEGQLGDGTRTHHSRPVRVATPAG